jgi:hypothetical protein
MSNLSFKQNFLTGPAGHVAGRDPVPLVRVRDDEPDGDDTSLEDSDHNWAVAVALACWPLCLGASAVWAVL